MNLNLKRVISEIRSELEALDREREAAGEPALFLLETLDLELKFTIATSTSSKGGFDLKIVSAGAEGGARDESIQTIRLQYRVSKGHRGARPVGGKAHSSDSPQPDAGIGLLE